MEELRKTISLHCSFCRSSQFAIPYDGYRPHHGSFVVCANCGRENDFTSLMLVVKRDALEIATEYAQTVLNNEIEKIKKRGFKFKVQHPVLGYWRLLKKLHRVS